MLAKTSNLGEYNEMKEEIKNRESSVEYMKILETYYLGCKEMLRTKILVLEELNKIY